MAWPWSPRRWPRWSIPTAGNSTSISGSTPAAPPRRSSPSSSTPTCASRSPGASWCCSWGCCSCCGAPGAGCRRPIWRCWPGGPTWRSRPRAISCNLASWCPPCWRRAWLNSWTRTRAGDGAARQRCPAARPWWGGQLPVWSGTWK